MATSQRKPQPSSRTPQPAAASQPLLIDPRWILQALGATLAVALLFAYATLCLLFYQGQWQLVLHPSRTVATTPASLGLTFSEVHLFPAVSGEPQLFGWLIPAANAAAPTALILHGADGSIADAISSARTLHNAGLNVLLFDYRGFGRSAGQHPDQLSMQEDAAGALAFLTGTQHIPPSNIVLFGSGLGASVATRLAADRRDIPAIILESPDGDLVQRASADSRARLVPTHWLFNQTFPLADPLHTLATPKLLISYTTAAPPLVIQRAADPKLTIELPSRNDPALLTTIHRFLDTYLPPH